MEEKKEWLLQDTFNNMRQATDGHPRPLDLYSAEKSVTGYTKEELINSFWNDKQEQGVDFNSTIQSDLSAENTLSLMDYMDKEEKDWKPFKAVYNGAATTIKGLLGAVRAMQEADIARQQLKPNIYSQEDIGKAQSSTQYLVDIINSKPLQRYDVRGDNALSQFGLDVLEQTPQLAAQIAAAIYGGAPASMALMAGQIGGSQYNELRDKGVAPDKALTAATINAGSQSVLEELSLEFILSKVPGAKSLKKPIKKMVASVVSEGATEGIQEVPEQLTNIWAEHPELDMNGVLQNWKDNSTEYLQQMGYAALLGGVMGGGVSGVNLALQNNYDNKFKYTLENLTANTKTKMQELHIQGVGEMIQHDISSGANPEYIAGTVDFLSAVKGEDNSVYIEADALRAYYQNLNEAEKEKVTNLLGVSEEEITEAATNGMEITTTMGGLRGAATATNGALFEAVKDKVSFDVDDNSINDLKTKQETIKDYREAERAENELNVELDKIRESLTSAGASTSATNDIVDLFRACAIAANPENPAEYFKRNPVNYVKGQNGEVQEHEYEQAFRMSKKAKAEYAAKMREVEEFVKANNIRQAQNGKSFYFELNGKKYRVSNHTVEASNAGAFNAEGQQVRELYHPDGRGEEVQIFASPTRIIDIYNAIKDGKQVDGRGRVVGEEYKQEADLYTPEAREQMETVRKKYEGTKQWMKAPNGEPTKLTEEQWLSVRTPKFKQWFGDNNIYHQQNLGAISWDDAGRATIALFPKADASTLIHEGGHYFFQAMYNDIQKGVANQSQIDDFNKLLKYCDLTMEQWQGMSFNERRAAHERVAEAFETYIMEGKAPSPLLRKIFNRFKKWLKAIYDIAKGGRRRSDNYIPINDELRGVFDRWFASEEEIAAMRRTEGYYNSLPKEVTDTLSDASRVKLQEAIDKAHETAVGILTKKSMENFTEERRKKIADFQNQIREGITKQVDEMPLYVAQDQLLNYTDFALATDKKTNPRTIARYYLNQDGQIYNDWLEEITDVQNQLDDILNPIIDKLKGGMGNGYHTEMIPRLKAGNDITFDESNALYIAVSDNDVWYQNWSKRMGRRPTKRELKEIAVALLTHDNSNDDIDMFMGDYKWEDLVNPEFTNSPEMQEFFDANKKTIDELEKRKAELLAQKDKAVLGKKKGLPLNDKVTFEVCANSNGFASGQELAFQILNMPTRSQMINQRIIDVTNAQFPDFWTDKKQTEAEVRSSLYNDNSAELVAMEQQIIYQALNNQLISQDKTRIREDIAKANIANAKMTALNSIRGTTNREVIKTKRFIANERRAAANAAKAIKDGNIEAAHEYKKQQLVAHEMVRLSEQIKASIRNGSKYIQRIAKKKKEYWYNQKNLDAIGDLLSRFGIQLKGYNPANATNTFADLVAELSDKYPELLNIDMNIIDNGYDISHPLNLTYEQFIDAINTVKNIKQLIKKEHAIVIAGKEQAFADFKQKAISELDTLNTGYGYVPKIGETGKAGLQEQVVGYMFRNTDNLFSMMDGWKDDGFWYQNLYLPLKHSADNEANMNLDFAKKCLSAFSTWKAACETQGIDIDEQVVYADLGFDGKGTPVSMTRQKLIILLCNLGNEDNMRRLCGTRILGLEGGSKIWVTPDSDSKADRTAAILQTRDNLLAFLGKYLSKADVDYAQEILNICGGYWPKLAQVDLATKGFMAQKVEATPVIVTLKDGQSVVMSGGYFPLVRDSSIGSHPFGKDTEFDPNADNQGRFMGTIATNQTHSKTRTDARYPVKISDNMFTKPIKEMIHDIAYREAMMSARQIFNDQDIFGKFKTQLGISATGQLRELLMKAANPYSNAGLDLVEHLFGNAFNALRRATVNGAIMLKFKTAFQNLSNLFLYANTAETIINGQKVSFGYTDIQRAMFAYFCGDNTKELKALCNKSIFMTDRETTPDISVRQLREEGKLNKIQSTSLDWGAKFLSYTDNLTAKPVWAAAYCKVINAGGTEQQAIDYADTIIRRTLGSSRTQDVAPMLRGSSMLRLFTTFQSFWNTQCNQWMREYNIDKRLYDEKKYGEALKRFSAFVAAKWFFTAFAATLLGGQNPIDKDKDGRYNFMKELTAYPLSMSGVPGQVALTLYNELTGTRGYNPRLLVIETLYTRARNAATAAGKLARGEAEFMPTLEAFTWIGGPFAGMPDQVNAVMWNMWDWFVNDMDFEIEDLFRRRPRTER